MFNKVRLQVLVAMGFTALVIHVMHHMADSRTHSLVEEKEAAPPAPLSAVKDPNEKKGVLSFEITEVDSITTSTAAKIRLENRRLHLKKVCQGLTPDEDIHKQRNLEITLSQGRLKMCGLEKTASTFMKQLSHREHMMKNAPKPKTDKYKTFVIVREPYVRLVSAYIDKLYTRTGWWSYFGQYIVEKFRFRAKHDSIQCGSDVTFPEFIRYWIHSMETDIRTEGHFGPMHKQCQFCLFDYDYYVHLETLLGDMEYIYNSVNATLISNMNDEEATTKDKAGDIINQRNEGKFKKCESTCGMLDRAWWSFHARGLVAEDVQNPFKKDKCDTVTKREFENAAWQAHVDSKARIDKKKQRRQKLVDLYLQVPLLDRLKVRDILMKDFLLHGYESTPRDMFPELHR